MNTIYCVNLISIYHATAFQNFQMMLDWTCNTLALYVIGVYVTYMLFATAMYALSTTE
jgi:hypothetical protein